MQIWLILGSICLLVWVGSCTSCSGPAQTSSKKDLGKCDISLDNCVSTLGAAYKDKCYETYHACVLGGENKSR